MYVKLNYVNKILTYFYNNRNLFFYFEDNDDMYYFDSTYLTFQFELRTNKSNTIHYTQGCKHIYLGDILRKRLIFHFYNCVTFAVA